MNFTHFAHVGQASEAFLQRLVALCVASHYRNTPNDLLLMADAPAHRLFVLLGPVDDSLNALPDILAVIQVGARQALHIQGQLSWVPKLADEQKRCTFWRCSAVLACRVFTFWVLLQRVF